MRIKTFTPYLRLTFILVVAIFYWLLTNFLGAMLGGAGHGFLLFYKLSLFPFDGGIVAYAIAGLLLGLNESTPQKVILIGMCAAQDAYVIYLISSGSVSSSSAVQAWEVIPEVFVANILCFALGQIILLWWILKPNRSKAKIVLGKSSNEAEPAS